MDCRIGRITFDCRDARQLADFYASLLLMPTRYVDSAGLVVIGNDANPARLAFTSTSDAHASTWPDPAFPLQIHLDVPVYDEAAAHELILGMGASRLPHLGGGCPVYADPAGHPFCLCAAPREATEEIRANSDRLANLERLWAQSPPFVAGQSRPLTGLLGGTVIDCFRAPCPKLADFYAELLNMPVRPEESDGWVVIDADDRRPRLAFQGADGLPPRWQDPDRPQQIHLDLDIDDLAAGEALLRRLGATKLDEPADNHVIYADPEGHPFCLRRSPPGS